MSKPAPISAALRAALASDPRSLRGLARAAGTTHARLSLFRRGKAGLNLETVDRLCAELGLTLEKGK